MVQSKSEKKNNILFCVLGGGGGGRGWGAATALMAQSRQRGHNLAKQGPTGKKMFSLIFYTDATYKILSS